MMMMMMMMMIFVAQKEVEKHQDYFWGTKMISTRLNHERFLIEEKSHKPLSDWY